MLLAVFNGRRVAEDLVESVFSDLARLTAHRDVDGVFGTAVLVGTEVGALRIKIKSENCP